MRHIFLTLFGLNLACASITASQTESFSVLSTPPGAEVRLNGAPVGTTPARVDVPRRMEPAVIDVSLAGHKPQSCPVRHSAGGGYVAADVVLCVLFFPIGCVSFVDANGAWNELVSSSCSVSLEPIVAPQAAALSPSSVDPPAPME